MMVEDPLPAPAEAEAGTTGASSQARPKRAPGRSSILGMRRETRVGIAALLSFVFLVTALVVKKGWMGKPKTLALAPPVAGEPTPPASGKKDEPKPKPAEDKKEPKKEQGSEPAPRAVEEAKPPALPPGEATGSQLTLAGDAGPTEPAALPPTGVENSKPATLASATPTATPPALPDDSRSMPPELPRDPDAAVALPVPGETPAPPPATAALTPAEMPAPAVETRPRTPESHPTPANGPPPLGDPPVLGASPAEKPEAPPSVASATPPPTMPPPPSPASPPVASAAPVPAEKPPHLEEVPTTAPPAAAAVAAGSVESAAARASTAGALSAGWVVIQSGGRRVVGPGSIVSTSSEGQVDTPRVVADGPRPSEDLAAADQVEPVVHVVRPGENFWTISRLYYRSGRFYRALHAANQRQVPNIRELYVGTVLRVPPPEALDRSLIDPPSRSNTEAPALSRTSKRVDAGDEADLAMPVRPRIIRPDPEAVEAPRRPTYKVKPHETLRSIARDTLDDPRRDREIYNLNRDVLDDINVLPAGTVLTLPEDASVGRRSR